MRKLSLLLLMCLMLVCFASCNGDKGAESSTEGGNKDAQTTVQVNEDTEAPTKEASTKAPETPQSNWTGRY